MVFQRSRRRRAAAAAAWTRSPWPPRTPEATSPGATTCKGDISQRYRDTRQILVYGYERLVYGVNLHDVEALLRLLHLKYLEIGRAGQMHLVSK